MPDDSQFKEQIHQAAEQQKEAGAERLGAIAEAVHGAARELEGKLPRAAEYVHDAASQLEGGAATLRDRSLKDLVDGFERLAREQPTLVFAGAAVAGLALSRFLKASNRGGSDRSRDR